MNRLAKLRWGIVVTVGVVLSCWARPASAQMSYGFSTYSDDYPSDDESTIYGEFDGQDMSDIPEGCGHATYTVFYLYSPSRSVSATGSSPNVVSMDFADEEGDWEATGTLYVYCSCAQNMFGTTSAITSHYSIKNTFYTGAQYNAQDDSCSYSSLACTMNSIPTCRDGKGIAAFIGQCPPFEWVKWLVRTRGASTSCIVGVVSAANQGGLCN